MKSALLEVAKAIRENELADVPIEFLPYSFIRSTITGLKCCPIGYAQILAEYREKKAIPIGWRNYVTPVYLVIRMEIEYRDICLQTIGSEYLTIPLTFDTLATVGKHENYRDLALYILESPAKAIRKCHSYIQGM